MRELKRKLKKPRLLQLLVVLKELLVLQLQLERKRIKSVSDSLTLLLKALWTLLLTKWSVLDPSCLMSMSRLRNSALQLVKPSQKPNS